jgi:hypothetical protein
MAVQKPIIRKAEPFAVLALGLFAILAWMAAILVFLGQCVFWLKWGYWFPLTVGVVWLALGFPYPEISWAGVAKLIDWLMWDAPLSLVLFAVAAGCVFLGYLSDDQVSGRRTT